MKIYRFLLILLFSSLLSAHDEGEAHFHEAKHLYQQHCFACHKFTTQKLAPPPTAIRRVYMDRYKDSAVAEERIATFLRESGDPLMKPAVKLFGKMPAIKLNTYESNLLAKFIITGNFPKPQWFEQHYQEHLESGELDHAH